MADSGNIVTYGRLRPSKRLATSSFALNHLDKQIEFFVPKVCCQLILFCESWIFFFTAKTHSPRLYSSPVSRAKDADSGYINNRKDRYAFTFSGGIFDAAAKQAEVFERVALPIAKNVLEGYNATIFCYGQTGFVFEISSLPALHLSCSSQY